MYGKILPEAEAILSLNSSSIIESEDWFYYWFCNGFSSVSSQIRC